MKLHYAVAMPEPETHLFHVSVEVSGAQGDRLRFVMPAWAPGSYLVRDFARHVQEAEAVDARGRALPVARVDKQTWEVALEGRSRVAFRYKVYANELSVQTSHLDATHGYANGTSLFVYVEGAKALPATLEIRPFKGWRVDVALPSAGPNRFSARDYDKLVDAPCECGTHRTVDFRAAGKPHRVAIYGQGNEDVDRIAKDLKAIVEEEAAIFGGLPYERYLFILHLHDRRGGGLEHRGSNTSSVDRWSFQPGKRYEEFLALEAHEFFHTWNVKRLRPAVLGPFDYTRENHTTLLWAMEGVTSYYDHLVLARLGLISEDRYREFLAETITQLRQQPGRFHLSLAQSSFLTWVKLYKQDANWVNTGVSYYLKGELIGLLLDLAIRDRTDGRKSLDDVMRALYEKYPASGPGIPEPHHGGEDGWRTTLEEVTGLSWRAFWETHIEGTEEVAFEPALRKLGWALRPVRKEEKPDEKAKKGDYATPGAWLGLDVKEHEKRILVARVLHGSPAMAAGLSPEDELVAFEGAQVKDKDFLERRLRERRPGDTVRLHAFRRGMLVETRATLAENPPEKWVLEEDKRASPRAKRLRRAWLAPLSRAKRASPVAGGKPKRGARSRIVGEGE